MRDYITGIYHAFDSEGHWDGLTDTEIIERSPQSKQTIEYANQRTVEILERFFQLAQAAERNKVAQWMMAQGYATGHGDTTEDLLQELEWQIAENWTRGMVNGVESEREACAKVADLVAREMDDTNGTATYIADAIRARGQA